jgi:SAM-dependent methyltransferase
MIERNPSGSAVLRLNQARILVPESADEIEQLTRKGTLPKRVQAHNSFDQQMNSFDQTHSQTIFDRSDYSAIRAFFDEAAQDYDSDLENPYFSFSHEVLKFILTTFITNHFAGKDRVRLFDAGAGTGNWSKFVLGLNESISATLFDMNPNMLEKARRKFGDIQGKFIQIIEGNLEVKTDYPPEKSDLILCMHNVIGMGRNIPLILTNLYNQLDEGGLAFIMTPNKYQAFDFTSKYRGEQEALRVIRDGSVKYRPDMPEMFCYTPYEFQTLLATAGFEQVTVLGYPVTIQPTLGDEELLQTRTTQQQLKDPRSRAALLEQEKSLCLRPDLAYKGGSSLIAVCRKNQQLSAIA